MEKQKNSVSWGQRLERKIFIFIWALVTVGVAYVLLVLYKPNQNALGALASVCMDVVCMMVMLCLAGHMAFEKENLSRTSKLFLGLMVASIWALFMDFLNWAFDGSLEFSSLVFIFTMLSLCMGSTLAGILSLYLGYYMNEMYGLKKVFISSRICAVINLFAFILTFTLGVTGQAFTYVNGHYEIGELYDYVTALPILTLIYLTIYTICHIKTIGFHDVIAVVGYIIIMIAGALLESAFRIGTTFVGITVANVYIFVMLQSKYLGRVKQQIEEEKKKTEKWMLKSNLDDMTGFFNRHAYEDEIALLEQNKLQDDFVYVSIDVNGLKIVNDTLGHSAGDELITGASECLKQCFGEYGKIFRTGGDEFVALIYVPSAKLIELKKEIKNITAEWSGTYNKSLNLSLGYVTNHEAENMTLHQVAVLADKRMYADKTRYYQRKGVDRRGQRDAHVALCALYTKILKINVTEDTFQIVNMDTEEKTVEKGFDDKISKWLSNFGTSGQVHPEDLEDYLAKTSLEYISSYFKRNQKPLAVFYRRKFTEGYKRVMMEMIPANDYSDESQNLFLYVKTIEQ